MALELFIEQQFDEDSRDLRIELNAGAGHEFLEHTVVAHALAVRSIEAHGRVRVRDSDDTADHGNVIALEAARIAGTVVSFVVTGNGLDHFLQFRHLTDEHLADDDGFVARFRREALAAAKLIHPNVVQVYDSGLDTEAHRHFIVMEYVKGPTVAQLLREHDRLPVEQAADIAAQACEGLEYAHRHGVIHRDVKPGNLIVNPDGVVKLVDFGIAKAAEDSHITKIGSVVGTAAYLSPERAQGDEATASADVYSLGVVVYQMLAGRLPYETASLTELATRQQEGAPDPLHELNREAPPALSRAVGRAPRSGVDMRRRPAICTKMLRRSTASKRESSSYPSSQIQPSYVTQSS